MNKKAFTFIELVVVITIIILISSSWVIYFFRQVSSLKLASEIEKLVNIVDKLDSEVDSRKILDYSINIGTSTNKLGFFYTTNNLWLDYRQELNMNFDTWTWILSTNLSTWNNYTFKIYSWIKFQWKNIIDSSDTYEYNFLENINYKIIWTLSWSVLNNIYINYYSSDNLIQDNENKLELININSKSDKTWISYNSLEIKNLNWKKSIIPDWWSDISKIYLFFEREWVEKFVEIKNIN